MIGSLGNDISPKLMVKNHLLFIVVTLYDCSFWRETVGSHVMAGHLPPNLSPAEIKPYQGLMNIGFLSFPRGSITFAEGVG